MRTGTRRHAIILIEALASLAIIAIAATILLQMSVGYLRARNDILRERALRLAAQAQLDRCRAGVNPGTSPPPGLLPPGIRLATTTTAGDGPWADMTRVTVTASCEGPRSREKRVTLSGYIAEARKP